MSVPKSQLTWLRCSGGEGENTGMINSCTMLQNCASLKDPVAWVPPPRLGNLLAGGEVGPEWNEPPPPGRPPPPLYKPLIICYVNELCGEKRKGKGRERPERNGGQPASHDGTNGRAHPPILTGLPASLPTGIRGESSMKVVNYSNRCCL